MDRNLYVADSNNYTIRKVVVATGVVTTLAGTANMNGSADGTGASARFGSLFGVVADGVGDLYVADTLNYTVRKVVLAKGAVTTLAGSAGAYGSADGIGGAARFANPSGGVVDGAGSLYLADSFNHTVRRVVLATGVVTTLAGSAGAHGSADGIGTAARFYYPYGVAADDAGNLYVTDSFNNAIRKVVLATGMVTTLAGSAGVAGSADGTGAAAQFYNPTGIATDGAGNLYIADSYNSTIRKLVVATGVVTTLAGTSGMAGSSDGTGAAARFERPWGVAMDGAGNLYVADALAGTIRKVVVATGAVTTLAGTADMGSGSVDGTGAAARFGDLEEVATDGSGNLYVADIGNDTIRKIVLANAMVTTVVGIPRQAGVKPGTLPARLNYPSAIAVSPGGKLVIVDESAVLTVQ